LLIALKEMFRSVLTKSPEARENSGICRGEQNRQ
jgi:hypothetical protein